MTSLQSVRFGNHVKMLLKYLREKDMLIQLRAEGDKSGYTANRIKLIRKDVEFEKRWIKHYMAIDYPVNTWAA
jgi:hypothetical protein